MVSGFLTPRAVTFLLLRVPWFRSCWDAARADNLHAAAIEAMERNQRG